MSTVTTSGYSGIAGRNEYFEPSDATTMYYITALDGQDVIFGYEQNDHIIGGLGGDLLAGFAGDDTLIGDPFWNDETTSADPNLAATADLILGDSNGNSSAGRDMIYAGGGNNYVNGEGGNDYIVGGSGNEYLQGGSGNDIVFGLGGNDVPFGGTSSNAEQDAFINANLGMAITTSYNAVDETVIQFLTTTAAYSGQVALTGTGDDYLDGGAGNDTIFGQDGNDTLLGGDGNDVLEGDTGNDLIFGGRGDDVLRGSVGSDTLEGDAGNDQLSGATGNDTINGGDGFDTVYFTDASGGVSVNLEAGTSTAYFGNAGNDTLGFIEAVVGTGFGDQVIGTYVANVIDTGVGNDVLYGALGADILIGGAGADRFVYAEQAESSLAVSDTILDFQSGVDKIDLSVAGAGRSVSMGLTFGPGDVSYLTVDFSQDGSVDMRIAFTPATNLVLSDLVF